jgi:hypothetical protein
MPVRGASQKQRVAVQLAGTYAAQSGPRAASKARNPRTNSPVIISAMNAERRVINFLELRPIMKLVFVPQSLILLKIEIVHTWLPDLFISRATSNNLTFVAVIYGEVKVAKPGRTIKSCADISKECSDGSNVDCISYLRISEKRNNMVRIGGW